MEWMWTFLVSEERKFTESSKKKKKVVETKRLARGSHWKHQNLLLSVRIVD